MYIERLIISGFKSYREHTVIDGFDRYFNAITGPNGSGKSNILDAICFVLGIQNYSFLRASGGLQDLIYKKGQSGVTKASVEIVFNNEDKDASPVGYSQFDRITVCRQITSGSSKYFINDRVANYTRVHNLFHSVQLNINNPHFLIMQGKIVQVLNMKPQEILGLIEEAAGIKMFEDKKEDSIRILNAKQKQLDEIDRIFKEELIPNLERLKAERDEYDRWASIKSEVDRMQRWVVAYKFDETKNLLKDGVKMILDAQEKEKELKEKIENLEVDIESKKKMIQELNSKKENSEKGEYVNLENEITKINKNKTKVQTQVEELESEIKRLVKKKQATIDQLESFKEAQTKKTKELENINTSIAQIDEQYAEAEQNVKKIEARINDVNIGIVDQNQNMSLSDEIEEKKKIISDCDIELKKITSNAPYLLQRKEELNEIIVNTENKLLELNQSIEQSRNEINNINTSIKNLNFDPGYESDLLRRREELDRKMTSCRDELNQLDRELGFLEFRYIAPPGLTKVYGPLIKLFKVPPQYNEQFYLALQKTAGGKLFNIVVDNKDDSHLLIYHGGLNKRYGFIPLKDIDDRILSKDSLNKAQRVINGRNASFALDMVDFDPTFKSAMRFAFGSSFICQDDKTAEDLAFHPTTKIRTVTTEGNVFDPYGVISGGYTENLDAKNNIIYKIALQEKVEDDFNRYKEELKDIENKLEEIRSDSDYFRKLKTDLEIATHQYEQQMLTKSNSASEGARRDLENINREIEENKALFDECTHKREVSLNQIKELKNELDNWNSQKNSKIAALEKELKKATKEFDKIKEKKTNSEGLIEQANLDLQSISSDIESTNNEIAEIENKINNSTKDKDDKSKEVEKLSRDLEAAKAAFKELKNDILQTKDKLSKCVKEETKLQQELTDTKIGLTKLENEIKTYQKDHETAKEKLAQMKKDYPWIEKDERYFGVQHTDFDFKKYEYKEAKEKLDELVSQQQELDQRVNKKVISQYDRAENEYKSLVEKKQTVEEEKDKINKVIDELETKKKEAIVSTHNKVSLDLKEIVSQVLPGTTAKLIPPPGKEVHEGLELVVSFNNLQKSLSELSGGQRSLIALAFVLALLKFKPAPVYILDEVDAALDLNHTQNIGKMLKKSFQKAQFIIVSLKEGMWNNANVVFRTSFRDSNSHVQRIENMSK